LSRGLPIIHIGDGQSDFCIVEKVAHVFTKKRLTAYCSENGIPHSPFHCFSEIERYLSILLIHMSKSGAEVWHGEKEKMEELWNQAR
jgi:2-hydroxy-3-keto-5-methylthiopentenyl-1-phosphate phosphatase